MKIPVRIRQQGLLLCPWLPQFGTIAKHLKSEGIVDVLDQKTPDLETASQLNKELEETFDEEQIFRSTITFGKK